MYARICAIIPTEFVKYNSCQTRPRLLALLAQLCPAETGPKVTGRSTLANNIITVIKFYMPVYLFLPHINTPGYVIAKLI